MMRNLIRLMTFVCALCCASLSHSHLPMGGWQTFFSYSNARNIIQSKDKIYALSDGNLYSVDKEYESIETYTKLTGLTDGNISKIAFCQPQNTLIIIYENCNIDLLSGSHITNVTDLKRAEMSNKKVNGITIHGNYAYLACGFGITVIDVKKAEIIDTYILGEGGQYVNVEDVVIHNDIIYARTKETIRYAPLQGENLADFNSWKNFYLFKDNESGKRFIAKEQDKDSLKNLGTFLPMSEILSFENSLLVRSNEQLLKVDDSVSLIMELPNTANISTGNRLIVSEGDSMVIYNGDFERIAKALADSITETLYDAQSKAYWICDFQEDGRTILQKYNEKGLLLNEYFPNGPASKEIAFIKYNDKNIFVGSGGPFDRALATPGVIQTLKGKNWSIITEKGMDTSILHKQSFVDVLDIAIDPNDPDHFFAATWKGLFEFEGVTLVNHYTSKNSPLVADGINILVDGLKYDKEGNLWMMNLLSNTPILIMSPQRTWSSLNYQQLQNTNGLRDLLFDSKGYLWVVKYRHGPGVFCANMNDTPLNGNDDRSIFLSSFKDKDSHVLTPTTVRCIAEDMDGVIWIGTDKGPMLIPDASKMFNSDFMVERVKITREDNANYADYLLENEQINAIVVDGNNRKWVGTANNGLYLLSADGKETIHHFTSENSPFTSNAIMDLVIDNKTGELYIVSSTGLFLYQSDAMEGAMSYSKAYAYPNPVRETYTGPITIAGLMENSQVRISDTEGRIIHEGDSNGGVYVWDGNDLNGRRVNTGIYFIYAAQADGSSKMVTKIAIIK